MKLYHFKLLVLLICADVIHGLFVPEQLPTLLSFIYTNIPPVRKGTDSRVGLGFRLGPNADFQVLFELGPQQNTLPIGPNANANTNKRETQLMSDNNNPTWLQLWKKQSANGGVVQQQQIMNTDGNTGSGNNMILLDEDVVNHLKQLYKKQPKQDAQMEDISAEVESNNNSTET